MGSDTSPCRYPLNRRGLLALRQSIASGVLALASVTVFATGCVSGAPDLTDAQEQAAARVAVYKGGEALPVGYSSLGPISSGDCSGAPAGGRVWGDAGRAIDSLKQKAAAMNADAVVGVNCSNVPLLNGCWAAKKCS